MHHQDTAGTPPERSIIERKVGFDGSVTDFACTLAFRATGLAVIRFELPGGSGAFDTPLHIPAGAVSVGYFWSRRPYNVYRIAGPDGEVVAHRFDAVTNVTISADVVSFRDLLLDWWALPDGTLIEEDRDEFERALAEGRLRGRDLDAARRAERAVLSRYRHIIDEVAGIEAQRDLRSPP